MLAVGEHTLGHVDDQMIKLTTGFAGGIGGTQRDLCGALSAGIMLIGARHGRAQPDADDRLCQTFSALYRDQFVAAFGTTCCREVRERHRPCAGVVAQAARILLKIMEKDENHGEDHLRD